jgi:hypothetical protein
MATRYAGLNRSLKENWAVNARLDIDGLRSIAQSWPVAGVAK